MTDPVVFLERTLSVVEERAKAAEAVAESPWSVAENVGGEWDVVEAASPVKNGFTRPPLELWCGEGSDHVYGSPAVAAHVAAMDPASVLRMVASTRKLLERCGREQVYAPPPAGEDRRLPGALKDAAALRLLAEMWGWTDD